jgi:uncharacterized protein (DUF488 family)
VQRDAHPYILTVGHSTHTLERFIRLLERHEVRCLADVRIAPRSRRMPHFAAESLDAALAQRGIRYLPMRELGGRRRPVPGSPNDGWRVGGFRGYADHMATPEFDRALTALSQEALKARTAIMCAEGLWWRCHRRLISDALLVRGWRVAHVAPDGRIEDHELTPFAVAEGERLIYPDAQRALDV